jgi:phage-related baseplate assembly protein
MFTPARRKEPILAAAKAQGAAYINEQRRLGRDVRLSAIYAALHVQGVQRVELMKPLADMVLDKTQASYCTDFKAELVALMNSLLPPDRPRWSAGWRRPVLESAI